MVQAFREFQKKIKLRNTGIGERIRDHFWYKQQKEKHSSLTEGHKIEASKSTSSQLSQ